MHGLAKLCIRRPVFATMLIVSLMVVGAFSYFALGVDLFPKIDIPTVQVLVVDPGAMLPGNPSCRFRRRRLAYRDRPTSSRRAASSI